MGSPEPPSSAPSSPDDAAAAAAGGCMFFFSLPPRSALLPALALLLCEYAHKYTSVFQTHARARFEAALWSQAWEGSVSRGCSERCGGCAAGFSMLRHTRLWPGAVSTVAPSLLRRAVALRWGVLGLRWDGDTNMCVLADGPADGLPRGTRLEMYGATARLVRTCAGGSGVEVVAPDFLTAVAGVVEAAASEDMRGGVAGVGLAPQPPPDGVLAEWLITTQPQQQQTAVPLMEGGVVFESPRAAGPRVLRAARQTFAQLLAREMRGRPSSPASSPAPAAAAAAAAGAAQPIAILDVSDADCAFSRVAVHVCVEGGLELERDFHVSYVPLSEAAAAAPGEKEANVTSLLRLVARPQHRPEKEPLRALPSCHFVLGCYTVHGGRPREAKASLGLELAHVISKLHRGGTLLVNLLEAQPPPPPQRAQAGGREDVALLRREAKAVVAEALSRSRRWGVISDEVLPAADCNDAAVSLVVSLD
ncbi:uncharacterized protein Tco025E_05295 [Trypanosoma conorhini]|uniref:Uncharacterized protein n=1 Tax=Trypanosoma conorhini TaxID=83891 RepID=A0A3R7KYS9_9TRYP|nr:uncharacterized protein Tco025E_05295 [Trypanosoma conorhini]RNF16099.1 hypothetical protein Tco025E_05295 [Trypanosoma conorhini]